MWRFNPRRPRFSTVVFVLVVIWVLDVGLILTGVPTWLIIVLLLVGGFFLGRFARRVDDLSDDYDDHPGREEDR